MARDYKYTHTVDTRCGHSMVISTNHNDHQTKLATARGQFQRHIHRPLKHPCSISREYRAAILQTHTKSNQIEICCHSVHTKVTKKREGIFQYHSQVCTFIHTSHSTILKKIYAAGWLKWHDNKSSTVICTVSRYFYYLLSYNLYGMYCLWAVCVPYLYLNLIFPPFCLFPHHQRLVKLCSHQTSFATSGW